MPTTTIEGPVRPGRGRVDASMRSEEHTSELQSLTNLPLADMLENRHAMSRTVRDEVLLMQESR